MDEMQENGSLSLTFKTGVLVSCWCWWVQARSVGRAWMQLARADSLTLGQLADSEGVV